MGGSGRTEGEGFDDRSYHGVLGGVYVCGKGRYVCWEEGAGYRAPPSRPRWILHILILPHAEATSISPVTALGGPIDRTVHVRDLVPPVVASILQVRCRMGEWRSARTRTAGRWVCGAWDSITRPGYTEGICCWSGKHNHPPCFQSEESGRLAPSFLKNGRSWGIRLWSGKWQQEWRWWGGGAIEARIATLWGVDVVLWALWKLLISTPSWETSVTHRICVGGQVVLGK